MAGSVVAALRHTIDVSTTADIPRSDAYAFPGVVVSIGKAMSKKVSDPYVLVGVVEAAMLALVCTLTYSMVRSSATVFNVATV